MSTDMIEGLFEASDHEYLSFGNLDDGLIVNNQPTYSDDFDTNGSEEQAVDDVDSIDITKSTNEFVDVVDYSSLSDHNYSNSVNTQMPATNFQLALLIQRNSSHKCGYCDKVFANITSLKSHVRSHTKEKPFKCEVCDKRFSQHSNLWKHIKIHTGERPFECPQCKRKFSQRANMQKHMLIHSGEKPYDCPYCCRTFSQLANRNKHVQLHLGTQPHKCQYCEKTFSQRSNMLKHQLLHEGVKPFCCEFCSVSFTQRGNLKTHLLLHADNKPYICEDCGKTYIQKMNLTKHKQQCAGQMFQSFDNLLDSNANSYFTIIQLDGSENSYYVNERNEFIKLEKKSDMLEIEEGDSNQSSSSSSA